MLLIVGLGNPGKEYEKTRHNTGFMAADKLQEMWKFSGWKLKKKFKAEISDGELRNKEIILAKPQTFMNNSGQSVKKIIKNWKPSTRAKLGAGLVPHRNKVSGAGLKIKNLIVIHDDLDIPLGKIKISKGRGAAGHKGVESIIKELKTKNFIRFRIGIKPKQFHRLVYGTEKFVLGKFSKEEEKILSKVIEKTVDAIEMAIALRSACEC